MNRNRHFDRAPGEDALRTWFAAHEPLRSASTVRFDRARFYRDTLRQPEPAAQGPWVWRGAVAGLAVLLVAMGSWVHHAQTGHTTATHPHRVQRPSLHHHRPSAPVRRDRQLGLPVPPPASAPLKQREHWIIVQSAPYGQLHHILTEWNALGQPPLYWSSGWKAYYFWVNRSADQAVTLVYTYALNDPPWYGKPLRP